MTSARVLGVAAQTEDYRVEEGATEVRVTVRLLVQGMHAPSAAGRIAEHFARDLRCGLLCPVCLCTPEEGHKLGCS